jgi:predicted tellurium resistance membrane protein TerC
MKKVILYLCVAISLSIFANELVFFFIKKKTLSAVYGTVSLAIAFLCVFILDKDKKKKKAEQKEKQH